MSEGTEMVVSERGYFSPTSMRDAITFAEFVSDSEFLPKDYKILDPKQKLANVIISIQFGAELGLSPMQSLQNISVVNSRPAVWGDAQLGIVRASGKMEFISEFFEGNPYDDDFKAVCVVKRKGEPEVRREFSVSDAKEAGLWDKAGTWKTHKKRMLQYKARAFALRDAFTDILKGLHSVEELQGEMINVTPVNQDNGVSPRIKAAAVPVEPERQKLSDPTFDLEKVKKEVLNFTREIDLRNAAPKIIETAKALGANEVEIAELKADIQNKKTSFSTQTVAA